MAKQIAFFVVLFITIGVFAYSVKRYWSFFKLTKPFKIDRWGERIKVFMKVVIGQTKIFRFPLAGFAHALVFWGFCALLFGVTEMIFDGILGKERVFSGLGTFYDIMIAIGDVSAFIVMIMIIIFLFRRNYLDIKRFEGAEMSHKNHNDAHRALTLILLVVFTLLGMNTFYIILHQGLGKEFHGVYPISSLFAYFWTSDNTDLLRVLVEIMWWVHIITIFTFANLLPYSKHFHVFMSAPNVLLSRLEPLGYVTNMPEITKEVKMMLDPEAPMPEAEEEISRFGVKDVQDVTWKNYLDSLTCTQCGRCSSVCPANTTGKKLSPRKLMMDLRARMDEIGPQLVKNGKDYSDNKSLINDYISEEELWACTLCNACAQECPVNINHPSLIVDLRRYLTLEEAKAPAMLNTIFTNIENNGAPWQYSPEDRLKWAENLDLNIPVLADLQAEGKQADYLFWVGSAGAFDDRAKKVSRAFVKILDKAGVNYAVLGTEETDSGDVARRTGNEMLFQMQALMNIEILNSYNVKKIITCDPHDFNTLKNEYPDLGGKYEVIHHTQFIETLINDKKITLQKNKLNKRIVYHDPCYLGRSNGIYETPRHLINKINGSVIEMDRNRSRSFCCGAGGGQMFKEAEAGKKEVYTERTEEALKKNPEIIATACPFCMVMLTDGLKYKDKIDEVKNYDIAELVEMSLS